MFRRDPKAVAMASVICGCLAIAAVHAVAWLVGEAGVACCGSLAFLFGCGLSFNVLTTGVSPP